METCGASGAGLGAGLGVGLGVGLGGGPLTVTLWVASSFLAKKLAIEVCDIHKFAVAFKCF